MGRVEVGRGFILGNYAKQKTKDWRIGPGFFPERSSSFRTV